MAPIAQAACGVCAIIPLLSNYSYDVVNGYTKATTIGEYMQRADIWVRGDYFTRFFNGIEATKPVDQSHVYYAFKIVSENFQFAFFGEDLQGFLVREVGLPVGALPRVNKTSVIKRMLHRASLTISAADLAELRRLNGLDYQLYDRLKAVRDQQRLQPSVGGMASR